MRCFSCNKKFDYEKYYGICPKCGCYNKPETSQAQHQAYHDQYDGGYRHTGEHYNTYTQYEKEEKRSGVTVQRTERKPKEKTRGNGILISGIVFLIISLFVLVITAVNTATVEPEPDASVSENAELQWEVMTYDLGQEFSLQKLTLKVTECRIIADWTTLKDLEKGKRLVAVRVEGTSDGEYEDYNRLAAPYVVVDGSCYRPLSSYDFEPYARMYDVMPLMDEGTLQWETTCDAWYVFLVDESQTIGQLCFEECAWDSWEKTDIYGIYTIFLNLEQTVEGGKTDETE